MRCRTDFHIHSCLSPCASLEMAPLAIVQRARSAGLDMIALADHNCAFNLPAFSEVCDRAGMPCLFGMEVTTREEAHMLCLFDDLDAALELGDQVYTSLPNVPNLPDRFGDQPIVNADNEIIGFAENFLISASAFDVQALLERVHSLGGLFIPAHIDRQVFGIIAQLGFLPDEDFDAVELTAGGDPVLANGYPVLRNSDAHRLDSLGTVFSEFDLVAPALEHIRRSLRG